MKNLYVVIEYDEFEKRVNRDILWANSTREALNQIVDIEDYEIEETGPDHLYTENDIGNNFSVEDFMKIQKSAMTEEDFNEWYPKIEQYYPKGKTTSENNGLR